MEKANQDPVINTSTALLALVIGLAGLACLWPNEYLTLITGVLIIGAVIFEAVKNRTRPSFLLIVYLLVFMGSASAGVWAAYATSQAITKFLILGIASLLAIYASQNQNLSSKIPILLALSAIVFSCIFLAILFLGIDQGELLTPNRFAGLIGLLTPFLIFNYLNTSSLVQKFLYLMGGIIISLALVVSGSRGGVVALFIGLGFWKLLASKKIGSESLKNAIITISIGFLLIIGTVGFFYSQQLTESLFSQIPGSGSRLTLYANLKNLAPDYWLIGSGLNSFSGNYSQYILSIPHLKFTYGHHLYLDLLLEQGIVGLSVFILLIGSSFALLLTNISGRDHVERHLAGAILASLTSLVLHGFIDNAIYSNAGSTMLFIVPALAFSINKNKQTRRLLGIINLLLLIIIIGAGALSFSRINSAWHSNIGAIEMARIQLSGWPTGEWSDGASATNLNDLESVFKTALDYHPQNASAEYRLGLISMENNDFPTAIEHLSRAYDLNQTHLGVKKNLGYALLWSGDIAEAEEMLTGVEGIHNELEAYRWWWQKLNRSDLSEIAHMAHQSGVGLPRN